MTSAVQSINITNHYRIKLVLVMLCASLLGWGLWSLWPSIIIYSAQWQRDINSQLTDLLYEAKDHNQGAMLYLVGLSFIYGALHSLGPGHGKVIVTTYVSIYPTKVKTSLWLTIVSAAMQAVVAIILVSAMLFIFESSMRQVNAKVETLIQVSYWTVALLGGLIIFSTLKRLWKKRRSMKHTTQLEVIKIQPLTATHQMGSVRSLALNETKLDHVHDDHCGCGHKHFANADEMNQASSAKDYFNIIFSIGIRPCSGAIMMLLFSQVIGLYWLGMVSAFVMAAGTALTTSVIALMAVSGKKLAQRYLHYNAPIFELGILGLRLLAGVLLILMSIVMLQSNLYGMTPIV